MTQLLSLDEVEDHLRQLKARKAHLLSEVDDVERKILRAKARQAVILNEINPALQLPHELITSIFFMACEEEPASRRSIPFQVVASHVCARWRSVATSVPLLWVDIKVNLQSRSSPKGSNTRLERFGVYLARSNACPFSLRIKANGTHDLHPFLHLLRSHLYRCRQLFLAISNNPLPLDGFLLYFGPIEAPILEQISVHVPYCRLYDYEESGQFTTSTNLFRKGSPALTFSRITGLAGYLRPPLASVTTLHLDGTHMSGVAFSQFSQVLRAAPLLVNLSLHHPQVNNIAIGSSHIVIPHLRSLRIRPYVDSNLYGLLSIFPVVQLKSLLLSRLESFDLIEFANVKNLTLEGASLSDAQAVGNLVRAFPAIESLAISGGELVPLILALKISGTPTWWPKLKQLVMHDLPVHDIPVFVDSIRARQAMDAPLKRLLLDRESQRVLRLRGAMDEVNFLPRLMVEEHEDTEPWPVGLGFEDEDDGFWH